MVVRCLLLAFSDPIIWVIVGQWYAVLAADVEWDGCFLFLSLSFFFSSLSGSRLDMTAILFTGP